MKKYKKIPAFKNEKEEKAFWLKADSTEYVDWSKAQKTRFPNLQRSTQTISLRLPESLLMDLKIMAVKRDVPYQSLMKIILSDATKEQRI